MQGLGRAGQRARGKPEAVKTLRLHVRLEQYSYLQKKKQERTKNKSRLEGNGWVTQARRFRNISSMVCSCVHLLVLCMRTISKPQSSRSRRELPPHGKAPLVSRDTGGLRECREYSRVMLVECWLLHRGHPPELALCQRTKLQPGPDGAKSIHFSTSTASSAWFPKHLFFFRSQSCLCHKDCQLTKWPVHRPGTRADEIQGMGEFWG